MNARSGEGAAVIVVGGGVTGLSAGWWLAREGIDVMVIEASTVGWGASGRNGGGCSHHHSPLFLEEQRLWPVLDQLLGYPTEFRPERIRIALDERQFRLYRRARENGARYGFHSDVLDAKQVRELVPYAPEEAYGGYFYHFGGHANPHRTVQAYAWALQDHGGRVLQNTPVVGLTVKAGRVTHVETHRGRIACDQLVIAAGTGTARLAAWLGVHVPLASARAEMIVTEPLAVMPIGGVDGNGLYGRQTLRGNLAYGGGPHEWLDDADGERTRAPLDRAADQHRAAPRPVVPEGGACPRDPQLGGVYREHTGRTSRHRAARRARERDAREPLERGLRTVAGQRTGDPRSGGGGNLPLCRPVHPAAGSVRAPGAAMARAARVAAACRVGSRLNACVKLHSGHGCARPHPHK